LFRLRAPLIGDGFREPRMRNQDRAARGRFRRLTVQCELEALAFLDERDLTVKTLQGLTHRGDKLARSHAGFKVLPPDRRAAPSGALPCWRARFRSSASERMGWRARRRDRAAA